MSDGMMFHSISLIKMKISTNFGFLVCLFDFVFSEGSHIEKHLETDRKMGVWAVKLGAAP